ncbi:MAG: TolC family protein [Planctomycetes bacterium]|nr:TolC family protein [Planctomycetota bacterium]
MIPALVPVLLLAALQSGEPQPLELTLDDALRLALENNLAIRGARLDADAAVESFGAAWGAFDTTFTTNATWNEGTSAPTPSNFVGGVDVGGSPPSKRTLTSLTTGLNGQFLTGTTWTFDIGPRQQEVETGSAFSEVFTGDWSLQVTHPLLRGGGDYARNGLVLARQDAEIASLAAETVASDTLEAVTVAYWNLVFARQDRATRELSVQLSTELLDITRRKFEQGLQNRINVTEVEAEQAGRREELLTAQTTEREAEDELRRLVLAPDESAAWDRPLVPATAPLPPQDIALDERLAIDTALRYRADLAEQRRRVERADVEVERAASDRDPLLDLTGGYGINANEQSYGDIYGNLWDTSFDSTNVALVLELPLGNRAAGYALRRAQVARQRAGVSLREAEMNAIVEVRTALRQVELQRQRVAATAETVRLQREVYEGERRRLENDLSTPFQVRQFQRDMLTAIDTATRAQLDLEVARADLLASVGQLLAAHGVERTLPELSLSEAPPAP